MLRYGHGFGSYCGVDFGDGVGFGSGSRYSSDRVYIFRFRRGYGVGTGSGPSWYGFLKGLYRRVPDEFWRKL